MINIKKGDFVQVTASNEQLEKFYTDTNKGGHGYCGHVERVIQYNGRVFLENGEIYEDWMLRVLE